MRVAIFTESFLPGIGGTENAILQYATQLSLTDDVLIVAPDYHRAHDDRLYPFAVYRTKSIPFGTNNMLSLPLISKGLRKTLDEFHPDVLHCQHWGTTCGFANAYAKKNRVPLVYLIHTKFAYCYKSALPFSRFIPFLMIKNGVRRINKADVVCAVSFSMAKELALYGYKKPVTVIKNGSDLQLRFSEKPKKQPSDPFVFLYVGLIVSYKNLAFSLRALSIVKKSRPNFVFNIVGRGPHVKRFKNLAKKLDLSDNVVFTGAITDENSLNRFYADADLFLFPSIFDSDGLVLTEAASFGTPALVLKDTGAAERITDGVTGFVSEPTVKAFADKILYLMENRNILETPASNGISISTPWKNIVDEYKKIYVDLIGQYRTK